MADYTSLATIKARLGIADTNDDATLAALITAASRAIDAWTKRPDSGFAPQTETRVYDVPRHLAGPAFAARDATLRDARAEGNWPNALVRVVAIDELITPTQVQTDDTGSGAATTTWAIGPTADCEFLPVNAPLDGRPYTRMRVLPWGTQALPVGIRVLYITGSWGFSSSTHPIIQEATILQVYRLYKRKDAPFGMYGDPTVGMSRLPPLDPDVKRMLVDGGFVKQWLIA